MKLAEQLKKHIPFEVKMRPTIINQLKKKGKNIEAEAKLKVEDVYDTGDLGGIVCVIPYNDEALVCSLTHLTIDDTHPLAKEIKMYQYKRTLQLKREGF